MWGYIITGVIALLVGGVGGFFIGVYYLRKQLEKNAEQPGNAAAYGQADGL